MANQSVSVTVSQPMFGLEPIHHFHVFCVLKAAEQFKPVLDRLAILLLNRMKV